MGFRDETRALRARVGALEAELSSARDDLRAREADRRELAILRTRVAELEAELAKVAPKPPPKPDPTRGLRIAAAVGGVLLLAGIVALMADFAPASPEIEGAPRRGVIDLDAESAPTPIVSEVTGAIPFMGPRGCTGFGQAEPLVVVRTRGQRRVRLWTDSSSDLTFFVVDADGRRHCDDDSGEGMNPRLTLDLPAGDHRVWVGTYTEDARASFTLHVDGRRLDEAGLVADEGEPTLDTIQIAGVDRYVRSGRADGATGAGLALGGCLGFVPNRPQVDLDVWEAGAAQIVAHSPSQDLVLLVRRPDGSFTCDDDSGGNFDPRIVEDLQIGRYRIWVGTYLEGHSAEFQLAIDVDRPRSRSQDATPRLGRWDLGAESVLSFTERVDGRAAISSTQPECRTFLGAEVPDVELSLSQARSVTLSLTSEARLGLLIEHPDGTQTCDTSMGSRPVAWSAGAHRIWIGVPTPGASAAFTLMVQTQPR